MCTGDASSHRKKRAILTGYELGQAPPAQKAAPAPAPALDSKPGQILSGAQIGLAPAPPPAAPAPPAPAPAPPVPAPVPQMSNSKFFFGILLISHAEFTTVITSFLYDYDAISPSIVQIAQQ